MFTPSPELDNTGSLFSRFILTLMMNLGGPTDDANATMTTTWIYRKEHMYFEASWYVSQQHNLHLFVLWLVWEMAWITTEVSLPFIFYELQKTLNTYCQSKCVFSFFLTLQVMAVSKYVYNEISYYQLIGLGLKPTVNMLAQLFLQLAKS